MNGKLNPFFSLIAFAPSWFACKNVLIRSAAKKHRVSECMYVKKKRCRMNMVCPKPPTRRDSSFCKICWMNVLKRSTLDKCKALKREIDSELMDLNCAPNNKILTRNQFFFLNTSTVKRSNLQINRWKALNMKHIQTKWT